MPRPKRQHERRLSHDNLMFQRTLSEIEIVGFSGTRRGTTPEQHKALIKILYSMTSLKEAYHGDCIGADEEFFNIIHEQLLDVRTIALPQNKPQLQQFRAYTNSDRILPGVSPLIRNTKMVRAVQFLIAAPRSIMNRTGGTWHAIREAVRLKKPMAIILPTGELCRKIPNVL